MQIPGSTFQQAVTTIDWTLPGGPFPILRCPITGEIIAHGYDPLTGEVEVEEYVAPDWANTPTVLFHYMEQVGNFQYIHPDLQDAIDATRRRTRAVGSDFEILRGHVEHLGAVPLVFELLTYSAAQGTEPAKRATTWIGLDLAAEIFSRSRPAAR